MDCGAMTVAVLDRTEKANLSLRNCRNNLWSFSECLLTTCFTGALAAQAQLRSFDDLGRRRKGDTSTVLKYHWLILVWHAGMHYRTVSIALHVLSQALVRVRPRDLADLGTVEAPSLKSLEHLFEAERLLMADEVHKRIPQVDAILEVHGQVHKIVQRLKLSLIKKSKERS